MTDYRIVRLQVQRSPAKAGKAPLRFYDPSSLVSVGSIEAGPQGVTGVADDGEKIIDIHHQQHPKSRDRKGRAGILFMGTGDYAALRERYGDHVADGIAGETVLLDAPDGLAGQDLPDTVTITTAAHSWTYFAVIVDSAMRLPSPLPVDSQPLRIAPRIASGAPTLADASRPGSAEGSRTLKSWVQRLAP